MSTICIIALCVNSSNCYVVSPNSMQNSMRGNLAGGGPASFWSDRVLHLGHRGENSCIFTTMTQTLIEKNYNRRHLRLTPITYIGPTTYNNNKTENDKWLLFDHHTKYSKIIIRLDWMRTSHLSLRHCKKVVNRSYGGHKSKSCLLSYDVRNDLIGWITFSYAVILLCFCLFQIPVQYSKGQ